MTVMEKDLNSPAASLRAARPSDAEKLATLHAASWRYAYRGALTDQFLAGDIVTDRLTVWSQRLQSAPPEQHVVVAEQDNEIIAFACAYAGSDELWGTLLDNLHVARPFQGQGIGTRLMGWIGSRCAEISPSQGLFLWVLQSNVPAQRFYERLGAHKVGSDIWCPPGGGQVPRWRYAWRSVQPLLGSSRVGSLR